MKLKNNKGVTLLILTVTVIILIIITSITVQAGTHYLNLKDVNELYSDIEAINVAISDYYLENDDLPIFANNPYLNDETKLREYFVSNSGGSGAWINPDDSGPYYVIDLSKLENLTLVNGREYRSWSNSSTCENYQDLYIINKVTHQVYYPHGVAMRGEIYYTKQIQ